MPYERERISSSAKLAELLRIVQVASPQNQAEKISKSKTETVEERKEIKRRARTMCSCGHAESKHESGVCSNQYKKRIPSCHCARFVPAILSPSATDFRRRVDPHQFRYVSVHPFLTGMFNLEQFSLADQIVWLNGATCIICDQQTVTFVYYDDSCRYSVPVCREHSIQSSLHMLTEEMRTAAHESYDGGDFNLERFVDLEALDKPVPAVIQEPDLKSFRNVKNRKDKDKSPNKSPGPVEAAVASIGVEGLTYTSDTPAMEISNWIFDEVMSQTVDGARYAITAQPRPQNFDTPEEFEDAITIINRIRFDFGIRLQAKCKERAPHLTVDQILDNLYRMKRIPWKTVED